MYEPSEELELPRPEVVYGNNVPVPVLDNYADGPTHWPRFKMPPMTDILTEAFAIGCIAAMVFFVFDAVRASEAVLRFAGILAIGLDSFIWLCRIANW